MQCMNFTRLYVVALDENVSHLSLFMKDAICQTIIFALYKYNINADQYMTKEQNVKGSSIRQYLSSFDLASLIFTIGLG